MSLPAGVAAACVARVGSRGYQAYLDGQRPVSLNFAAGSIERAVHILKFEEVSLGLRANCRKGWVTIVDSVNSDGRHWELGALANRKRRNALQCSALLKALPEQYPTP